MMSETPENARERCDDLLLKSALSGLDPAEQQELDGLIDRLEVSDEERFENAIGALDTAFHESEVGSTSRGLSDQLRSRIIAEAAEHMGVDASSSSVAEKLPIIVRPTAADTVADSGWSTHEIVLAFVTAASLMFALASFAGLSGSSATSIDTAPSAEIRLTELRENNPIDLRVVSWTNPTDDAASKEASGEVVWSDGRQEGFMVFDGLDVNDPTVQQYQLWIFDKERDDALPVDGGVFDISASGKVVIPIDAKLSISEATMFAITIEQPGGVVQSKRERLPLLAKIDL